MSRDMRVLRRRELVAKVGLSIMTIWRRERDGTFPRRVRLGCNSVGWIEEEVDAWLQMRRIERDAKRPPAQTADGFARVKDTD